MSHIWSSTAEWDVGDRFLGYLVVLHQLQTFSVE